jgi:hypothetical protein
MDVKARINDLEAYQSLIKGRLEGTLPDKHKARPKEFKAYLEHELKLVNSKLEKLKMEGK